MKTQHCYGDEFESREQRNKENTLVPLPPDLMDKAKEDL
ncbi:IS66 family transposase zinc-finger binding domain protein [Salmonella phage 18-India]|nr:IS66 family transposase zinc-finger binding domain protein [Salmonella phage 18-India]